MYPRRLIVALLLGIAAWTSAHAVDYPNKAIRFICTSAAGSPLDTMMRQLARQLESELKQSVFVENRAGGSGAVGMAYATGRPADGYTVISATGTTSFMMASGELPYTPDDFIVLRGLQAEPSAVAVRRDSPFHTLRELVDALRQTSNQLHVGGYAAAGFHQFVFYRLQEAAKIKSDWIPYEGGNQAAVALLGGHIDVAIMTPSSAIGQVKSGEIRLLGISTATRDPFFPEVPTLKEQGYDVVESIWRGIMVKKGTPQDVLSTLASAIDRVEATPDWQKFMQQNLQSPLHLSMNQMQSQVRAEVASRREFLKKIGLVK